MLFEEIIYLLTYLFSILLDLCKNKLEKKIILGVGAFLILGVTKHKSKCL